MPRAFAQLSLAAVRTHCHAQPRTMGDRGERATVGGIAPALPTTPALIWTLAIALLLGFALCALGCEGPGLEPPFMGTRSDAGVAPQGGSGGRGSAAGAGSPASGAAGKGGSGGSAGSASEDRDGGVPADEADGGSDEDAGSSR